MGAEPKPSTRIILAFYSLGRCAKCSRSLVADDATDPIHIAECAHIKGENPGSARYDPAMTDEQRRAFDNLLYLCPICHTEIDKQCEKFPVDALRELRAAALRRYRIETGKQINQIGFSEVEIVCKSLVGDRRLPTSMDLPTPVHIKMMKNDLVLDETRSSLELGLGRAPLIREFLDLHGEIYPGFSERLKNRFRENYANGIADGLRGDNLFNELHALACPPGANFALMTAAMAVLCYLFESCEVFEP